VFLFIFESIGTSELILVGIIALIFLGPRKLPEIARKIGKITAEFRGTANEFKETWQREVDFEEETSAFDLNKIESETIARGKPTEEIGSADAPIVRQIDPSQMANTAEAATHTSDAPAADADGKETWL